MGLLLRDVSPVWQQNKCPTVETVQDLADLEGDLAALATGSTPITALQLDDVTSSISSIVRGADEVPGLSALIKYTQVVDNYAYMGTADVPAAEAAALLAVAGGVQAQANANAQAAAAAATIPVTIMTGVPGSGKLRVCASITALAKEGGRWVTLRPDVQTEAYFDAHHLQDQLATFLTGCVWTQSGGICSIRVWVGVGMLRPSAPTRGIR